MDNIFKPWGNTITGTPIPTCLATKQRVRDLSCCWVWSLKVHPSQPLEEENNFEIWRVREIKLSKVWTCCPSTVCESLQTSETENIQSLSNKTHQGFVSKFVMRFTECFFLMVKCPGNPGNKLCKTWSLISIGKQDHWFESIFANMKYHEISIELLKQLSVSIWSLGMMWSYNSHTYTIHDFWTMNSEPWETSKQTKSAWSFGL